MTRNYFIDLFVKRWGDQMLNLLIIMEDRKEKEALSHFIEKQSFEINIIITTSSAMMAAIFIM